MEPVTYCSWLVEVCATEGEWLGFWGGAGSAVMAFLGAIAFESRLRRNKAGKTRKAVKGQLTDLKTALAPFEVDPRTLHPQQQIADHAPEQLTAWNAIAATRAIVRWGVGFPDHLTPRQWSEIENLRSIIDLWDRAIDAEISNLRQSGKVSNFRKAHTFRKEVIDQVDQVLKLI